MSIAWKRMPTLFVLGLLMIMAPAQSPRAADVPTWREARTYLGVAYFLYTTPPQIVRYDMASQQSLTTLTLSGIPVSIAVDQDGIFIGYSDGTSRIAKMDFNGHNAVAVCNTGGYPLGLVTAGGWIIVQTGMYGLECYAKLNGTKLGSTTNGQNMIVQGTLAVAPGRRQIYASAYGALQYCLVVDIQDSGALGPPSASRNDFFQGRDRIYVFPSENLLCDNSGIVVSPAGFPELGYLGAAIKDLTFYGDQPVALRGNMLVGFSNGLAETGHVYLTKPASRAFQNGNAIFTFGLDTTGTLQVERTPVSSLNLGSSPVTNDPEKKNYQPDAVLMDKNEVVLLPSGLNLRVFRWSVAQKKYLDSVTLTDPPKRYDYSAANHALYLTYYQPLTSIKRLKLDQAGAKEELLANISETPGGVAAADPYIFVADCDAYKTWATHYVFSASGQQLANMGWTYQSQEYAWNPVKKRIYQFSDGSSPNLFRSQGITTQGIFGTDAEESRTDIVEPRSPIRVSPDGSLVVTGWGTVYNCDTLKIQAQLSTTIDDAAWIGQVLYTIRAYHGLTQLQCWTAKYAQKWATIVAGTPLRMFATSKGLLLVTQDSGRPKFTIINPAKLMVAPEVWNAYR